MQMNDMVIKARVYVDGTELTGLVKIEEAKFQKTMVDVPEFRRIRKLNADVQTIPQFNMVFKVSRTTPTHDIILNWYENNEVHDVTVEYTDAHGVAFERKLLQSCECTERSVPAYDAASPTYYQTTLVLLPYEVVNL